MSIEDRHNDVEDKESIGDWGFDIIVGKEKKGEIFNLVDRKRLLLWMVLF